MKTDRIFRPLKNLPPLLLQVAPLLYALAVFLVLLTGFVLRFADLQADPPLGLSKSAGFSFDGQSNAHGARSYVLFGDMRPDEWDTYLYSPTYTLLQIPWFKQFGTDLWSTNAFAAMWSSVAMLLAVFLFRHHPPLIMLSAAVAFAFEFMLLQLGRVGLVENLVIVCMLASVCCLEARRHVGASLFGAGFFAMGAFITKAIVPYFPLAVMMGVTFRGWQDGSKHQRRIQTMIKHNAFFLLGLGTAFIPWLLLYRLPNAEAIQDFGGEWIKMVAPESLGDALAGMTTTSLFFNLGKVQNTWVLALPTVAVIGALLFLDPRKISAAGVTLAAWLVGGSLFVSLLRANPLRYFYPIMPAAYLTIVYGLLLAHQNRFLRITAGLRNLFIDIPAVIALTLFIRYYTHYRPGLSLTPLLPGHFSRIWELMLASLLIATMIWVALRILFWFFAKSTMPLPKGLKLILLLVLAIHFVEQNKEALRQRSRERQHTIVTVSRMLGQKYPGMIIAGTSACTAVVETPFRAVRVTKPEWCNWEDPFGEYGVTHTFISDYAGEARRYFRLYPEAMTNAIYRESVTVCGYTYKIYETEAYKRTRE